MAAEAKDQAWNKDEENEAEEIIEPAEAAEEQGRTDAETVVNRFKIVSPNFFDLNR